MRLEVSLPDDRSKTGSVVLRDEGGRVIAGPFPAIGRAGQGVADKHGNPDRDPVHPYGNTPLGEYWYRDIVPSGNAVWSATEYGNAGVIRMIPRSGEALAAEANGRTVIFIHAGPLFTDTSKERADASGSGRLTWPP